MVLSEQGRGTVTSVFSGLISSTVHMLFGVHLLNLSAPTSAFWFVYVFGSLLAYSLDIVFAKRTFKVAGVDRLVPYDDIGMRLVLLMRSFMTESMWRYAILTIFDTLLGLMLISATIRLLDKKRIMQKHAKMRNALVALAIPLFTFFLYLNPLLFTWAYNLDSPIELTVLITLATALVLTWFVTVYATTTPTSAAADAGACVTQEEQHKRHG